MDLYREYFESLKEEQTEPFLLGYIGRKDFNNEKIEAKVVDDDNARHPREWAETGLTWRFVPEIGMLTFWEPPSKTELELVKSWLTQQKYKISKTIIYGQSYKVKKYKSGTPEMQRKPLGVDENSKSDKYCGVLLDNESRNKLKSIFGQFIPDGWTFKCHHMTVDPFKACEDESQLGKPVSLMVTHIGKNDTAYAVKVVGYKGKTNNAFPHVTIAVNTLAGGQAKDSNKITDWTPIAQHIVLNGTIENMESNPINEAPLGSFTTLGFDDKAKSFQDPRDRASITNPATLQKVKGLLKHSPVDIDMYFVNKPGLRQFSEKGKVNYEFLVAPYPKGLGLNPNDITLNPDNITVFYVSNVAAQKIPMTAWTIIHRLGHAVNRTLYFTQYTDHIDNQFDEFLGDYYGIRKKKDHLGNIVNYRTYQFAKGRLFEEIGKMRSARDKKLHLRYFEFYYELMVQYFMTGKIEFNPVPDKLIAEIGGFQHKTFAILKNKEDAQFKLNQIAADIPYYLDDAMSAIVGDIFVM